MISINQNYCCLKKELDSYLDYILVENMSRIESNISSFNMYYFVLIVLYFFIEPWIVILRLADTEILVWLPQWQ